MSECSETIESALTNDEMMTRTLALLERYNIVGVLSGDDINLVRRWKAAAPDRIIRSAIDDPPDSIRQWAASGSIKSLGEMGFQYLGLSGNDSMPESYFALAEELDLPIGVHVGLGPPGAPYMAGLERYRMRLSNPLLLEDALVRHPKMRLYVMHAGWPMLDEMIGLLYAHPQVYVDVGVIDWAIPRAEFYTYLRRLVEAGFSKRIMFGSDEMIWPDAIPIAINSIQAAPFLSAEQKRDILYNNAVRFLRIGKRNGVATSSR